MLRWVQRTPRTKSKSDNTLTRTQKNATSKATAAWISRINFYRCCIRNASSCRRCRPTRRASCRCRRRSRRPSRKWSRLRPTSVTLLSKQIWNDLSAIDRRSTRRLISEAIHVSGSLRPWSVLVRFRPMTYLSIKTTSSYRCEFFPPPSFFLFRIFEVGAIFKVFPSILSSSWNLQLV